MSNIISGFTFFRSKEEKTSEKVSASEADKKAEEEESKLDDSGEVSKQVWVL